MYSWAFLHPALRTTGRLISAVDVQAAMFRQARPTGNSRVYAHPALRSFASGADRVLNDALLYTVASIALREVGSPMEYPLRWSVHPRTCDLIQALQILPGRPRFL